MPAPRRLVASVLAVALVATAASTSCSRPPAKDIGAHVSVTANQLPKGMRATEDPKVVDPTAGILPSLTPHPISVTPSGKLPASTTLTFSLSRKVPEGMQAIVFTKEDNDTEWTTLPTTISSDRRHVVVHPTHLSNFLVKLLDFAGKAFVSMAQNIGQQLIDSITSELFVKAPKPSCSGTTQALSNNYRVGLSAREDALYWCIGMNGNKRVLKLVNRLDMPLEIDYNGMSFIKTSNYDVNLELLANINGTQQGGKSKFVTLIPDEEVDLAVDDLPNNHYAIAQSSYSRSAELLYELQFNMELAVQIMTKMKLKLSNTEKNALDLTDELLKNSKCVTAIRQGKAGDAVNECFSDKQLSILYGGNFALVQVVQLATGVFKFLKDAVANIVNVIKGADKAAVQVIHQQLFTGVWREGSSTLTFSADGKSATRHWIMNACSTPNGDHKCYADATLNVSVSDTTATLTYRDYATFHDSLGGSLPGDPGDGEPELGDKEVLKYVAPGLLSRTMVWRPESSSDRFDILYTHYWCGQGVSADNRKKCGIVN